MRSKRTSDSHRVQHVEQRVAQPLERVRHLVNATIVTQRPLEIATNLSVEVDGIEEVARNLDQTPRLQKRDEFRSAVMLSTHQRHLSEAEDGAAFGNDPDDTPGEQNAAADLHLQRPRAGHEHADATADRQTSEEKNGERTRPSSECTSSSSASVCEMNRLVQMVVCNSDTGFLSIARCLISCASMRPQPPAEIRLNSNK